MSQMQSDDQSLAREMLKDLENKVTLRSYVPSGKNIPSEDMKGLVKDLSEMSENVEKEIVSEEDAEEPLERYPSLIVIDKDEKPFNLIFHGTPSVNLLKGLLYVVKLVANKGSTPLTDEERERARKLPKMELMLLSTPSTPKVDEMLWLYGSIILENPNINLDVVELIQFPEVAEEHNVIGLPVTVESNGLRFTGDYEASDLLKILEERISDQE